MSHNALHCGTEEDAVSGFDKNNKKILLPYTKNPNVLLRNLHLQNINLLRKIHKGKALWFNPLIISILMSHLHLRGLLFVARLVSYDRINRKLSNLPLSFQVNIVQAFVET